MQTHCSTLFFTDLANEEVMQHHDGTDTEVNCRFVCLKRQSRAV